jgi:3-keto-5-aminohexanoate cleavage enzyme
LGTNSGLAPLVITATPNNSWMTPDAPYPKTPEEISAEAARCEQAGAAIFHLHAITEWKVRIDAIRQSSRLLVQGGMSSLLLEERQAIFDERADMISVIANHHDEAFPGIDANVLHTKEELVRYCELGKATGVRPEWEIWHAGSIWNLNYLREHTELDRPIICTLFFGWPGGTWSPPTPEEYLARRRLMPNDCIVTVSVMGPERYGLLAAAIAGGDHVRVGTEDHAFDRYGKPAQASDLVAETAALADALGRPVATTDQAREILGFGPGGSDSGR